MLAATRIEKSGHKQCENATKTKDTATAAAERAPSPVSFVSRVDGVQGRQVKALWQRRAFKLQNDSGIGRATDDMGKRLYFR